MGDSGGPYGAFSVNTQLPSHLRTIASDVGNWDSREEKAMLGGSWGLSKSVHNVDNWSFYMAYRVFNLLTKSP